MRYVLVLQWDAASAADLERLIAMEDKLHDAADFHGVVDGHDFGSGEMNIFILTDQPTEAFADVRAALRNSADCGNPRVAYRPVSGDRYEILWPSSLNNFAVI